MSDANPVSSVSQTTSTAQDTSTTTSTTAAPGTFNASSTVSNMGELQAKAPELYKAMMMGVATNICNEMKDHQEKLKEMMREAERNAKGG